MADHTPGPWKVEQIDLREAPMVVSPHGPVAEVYGGSVRVSELGRLPSRRRANANLIAAAPDLLRALTDVLALIPDDALLAIENPMTFAGARAAMLKAREQ